MMTQLTPNKINTFKDEYLILLKMIKLFIKK